MCDMHKGKERREAEKEGRRGENQLSAQFHLLVATIYVNTSFMVLIL